MPGAGPWRRRKITGRNHRSGFQLVAEHFIKAEIAEISEAAIGGNRHRVGVGFILAILLWSQNSGEHLGARRGLNLAVFREGEGGHLPAAITSEQEGCGFGIEPEVRPANATAGLAIEERQLAGLGI